MIRYVHLMTLAILVLGCNPILKKREFFSNMTHYSIFNSAKDKHVLLGFDSVIISKDCYLNDKDNLWTLHSSENSYFNIEGLIWLKDSIVYVKANESDRKESIYSDSQVLFNFCDSATKWVLKYRRNGVLYFMQIENEKKGFNINACDTVNVFRINKNRFGDGFGREILLQASIKKGFVSVLYLNRGEKLDYIIDFLPRPILEVHEVRVP